MDGCCGTTQLSYGEFSEMVHNKVVSHHIPISGSLEMTMRCNLRCQHCYVPINQRAGHHEEMELSLPEIKNILDEVTESGCLWMLLTGGEPLIRQDFIDIYSYAKHKGLLITLFTNGTLLTPRIADYLAEWRPFNIEITLYGATQETYEKVTGIPGSYTHCRRGINLLLERNLPLSLKTMVMTLNHHELENMKILAQNLGVQFRFDPIIHPTLDGSSRPNEFRLKPNKIVEIELADSGRAERWPKLYHQNQAQSVSDKRMYQCGAGKQAFHIDAFGNMYPCMSARKPTISLRNSSFRKAWEQILPMINSREYNDNFSCLSCEIRLLCAQCPAMSELEHGESEKRVDFLCQVAKLRKDMFT